MSDKSGISWTDATWNIVTGCDKVSPGCKNCYALRDWARLAANPKTVYYGRKFTDVATHAERLSQPLRWTKPRMIFVNSMSDLFHKDVPFEFIAASFGVMALASSHIFQVLTKRPERMLEFFNWLNIAAGSDGPLLYCLRCALEQGAFQGVKVPKELLMSPPTVPSELLQQWPLKNVWLGVSTENQATADERVPLLLRVPAAVRWVSAEPLLGPLELDFAFGMHLDEYQSWRSGGGLDWVVVGGESGPKARPMKEAWALSLREQCKKHKIPFFFKQWGEWQPAHMGNAGTLGAWSEDTFSSSATSDVETKHLMVRAGSNASGWDELGASRHAEFPASLRT